MQPNAHSYPDGDSYIHSHPDAHRDGDVYAYRNCNSYRNGNVYANSYADCNGYFIPHGNSNRDVNADIHTYRSGDCPNESSRSHVKR